MRSTVSMRSGSRCVPSSLLPTRTTRVAGRKLRTASNISSKTPVSGVGPASTTSAPLQDCLQKSSTVHPLLPQFIFIFWTQEQRTNFLQVEVEEKENVHMSQVAHVDICNLNTPVTLELYKFPKSQAMLYIFVSEGAGCGRSSSRLWTVIRLDVSGGGAGCEQLYALMYKAIRLDV